MLSAIAQMHDKRDKLVQNEANAQGENDKNDTEYSVEALFPEGSEKRELYNRLKKIIHSVEKSLGEMARMNYVSFKKGKGAGTNTAKTGICTGVGVFTIMEVKSGKGSDDGWGRLKSGAGWISLDYCQRV